MAILNSIRLKELQLQLSDGLISECEFVLALQFNYENQISMRTYVALPIDETATLTAWQNWR